MNDTLSSSQTKQETDEDNTPPRDGIQAYSAFTKRQKLCIVLLIAFAGWFSTLSSFIYFPAITPLADDLGTTVEKINLTVTSYMVVSGLAPSIVGDLADMMGRRPVYIATLTIYFAANIGLALQRSFPALLLLRMLQSAGISGTFSVAYGVVADIASPAERGSLVGILSFCTNTAPSIGPVLGGVLAASKGWRWIFWFLTIASGSCLIFMILFLPETARNVVGNGTAPVTGVHKALFSPLTCPSSKEPPIDRSSVARRWYIPKPLTCLYLLFHRNASTIIFPFGIFYMTYSCIQASLSSLFLQLYHFGELQSGLVYLPFGVGCALATLIVGKVIDRDYRHTAKLNNFTIDRVRGDDLSNFPIEKARLKSFFYPLVIGSIAIAGYGWALAAKTHASVPLVIQFIIGSMLQSCFTHRNMALIEPLPWLILDLQILNTLLIDLHPRTPSTAQASCNLIRCALAAIGLAVVQILINHVGVGWSFTLFALLCGICVPPFLLLQHRGMTWRCKDHSTDVESSDGCSHDAIPLRGIEESVNSGPGKHLSQTQDETKLDTERHSQAGGLRDPARMR